MVKRNTEQWLTLYFELSRLGFVGRFLHNVRKEFERDHDENENILDWCVRKALETLND